MWLTIGIWAWCAVEIVRVLRDRQLREMEKAFDKLQHEHFQLLVDNTFERLNRDRVLDDGRHIERLENP